MGLLPAPLGTDKHAGSSLKGAFTRGFEDPNEPSSFVRISSGERQQTSPISIQQPNRPEACSQAKTLLSHQAVAIRGGVSMIAGPSCYFNRGAIEDSSREQDPRFGLGPRESESGPKPDGEHA